MAETEATSKAAGSSFGFLGHKLFGKVPVWVVAVAAVGVYYWYTKYGPGKSTSTQPAGSGTDPAGNTGLIDPSTGYVYGTPEDLAALNAANAGSGGSSGGGDGGGSSGGGSQPPPVIPGEPPPLPGQGLPGQPGPVRTPKPPVPPPRPRKRVVAGPKPKPPRVRSGGKGVITPGGGSYTPHGNVQWGELATSNLISQGVPPDMASTSVQAHLNGQPLSPAMAANRDLAIQSIGSPPRVPEPGQMKAPQTAGAY